MEATLATMSGLARFRGHFYNWYDTRDLRPLDPRYVSTVDSGNLAGHLIALANACREWRARPLAAHQRLAGVADALEITRAESVHLRDGGQTQTVTLQPVRRRARGRGARRAAGATFRRRSCGATGRSRRRGRDHGRHRRRAGDRTRRRQRRRHAVLGASEPEGDRRAPPRSGAVGECGSRCDRAARRRWKTTARSMALAMEFGFLFDREPATAVDRISGARRRARHELLRSAGVRGAARQLLRHRQGRRRRQALVPARPRRDAGRPWRRADFVVGIDVRVSDAVAGHARAGGQPARADQPSGRAPADRLRRQTRSAVGHFGIRLQRPRPGVHLPIFEFRRSRPRLEARPRREPGHRPLCHRAGGDGRPARRGGQSRASGGGRRRWPLRLFTRRWIIRRRACPRARPSPSCAPSWRIIRA